MSSNNTIGTAYVQIEPSFEGVTPKLESHFGGAGTGAGGKFGSGFVSAVGGAIGKVGMVTATALAGATAAGGAAVVNLVKQASSSFGEYQQLVGGVETLFGNGGATMAEYLTAAKEQGIEAADAMEMFNMKAEAQELVLQNAANAYKTAGMDANSYMETVTSFSASLLQSVGGDSLQAAKTADMAIIDMSDNANKMGTSMESIQNALTDRAA